MCSCPWSSSSPPRPAERDTPPLPALVPPGCRSGGSSTGLSARWLRSATISRKRIEKGERSRLSKVAFFVVDAVEVPPDRNETTARRSPAKHRATRFAELLRDRLLPVSLGDLFHWIVVFMRRVAPNNVHCLRHCRRCHDLQEEDSAVRTRTIARPIDEAQLARPFWHVPVTGGSGWTGLDVLRRPSELFPSDIWGR